MSQRGLNTVLQMQKNDGQLRWFSLLHLVDKSFSKLEDEKDPIFMGFEWESAVYTNILKDQIKDMATNEVGQHINYRSGGDYLEMVSVPATMAYLRRFMEQEYMARNYEKALAPSIDSGIHVHIDKKHFTPVSLTKFMAFISLPMNNDFITGISGRALGRYCSRNTLEYKFMKNKPNILRGVNIKFNQNLEQQPYQVGGILVNSKAAAVSTIGSYKTIEFRIFNSTTDPRKLISDLEFTDAVIRYTRQSTYNKLTPEHFCQWLKKHHNEYPYLMKEDAVKSILKRGVKKHA